MVAVEPDSLLARDAGPLVGKAGRQLGGDAFHLGHGGAGAHALAGSPAMRMAG